MNMGKIALIPARAGSKRLLSKNITPLNGHPLIAYTIAATLASQQFAAVVVSTDSDEIAAIARYYGAEVPFMRPAELAADLSPDYDWIRYTLDGLSERGREYDCFSILRPTSPFRQADTIVRAMKQFSGKKEFDSLRAVELCKQHPGKMWKIEGDRMFPLLSGGPINPPWHSSAYQALPPVYVQNASLEIAWVRVIYETGTIAGNVIMPFLTEGCEGVDINSPNDLIIVDNLIRTKAAQLPVIGQKPYGTQGEKR